MVAFVFWSLRGGGTLVDLTLFRDRAFAAASGTTFIFGVSLFGAMLILPLYYQVVREQSALSAGLLLAPQGIGAAIAMPIAGRLTDKLGAGRIVPFGVLIALTGTLAFTQLSADHELHGAGLRVVRPRRRARHDDDAVDGRRLPDPLARRRSPRHVPDQHHPHGRRLGRHGGADGDPGAPAAGLGRVRSAPRSRARGDVSAIAGPLAAAFAHTFWWAVGLTALALIPAWFLPAPPAGCARGGGNGEHATNGRERPLKWRHRGGRGRRGTRRIARSSASRWSWTRRRYRCRSPRTRRARCSRPRPGGLRGR